MKQAAHSARTTAFTLLELLVVIAVIAILASLLFPTISKGKASAHSTQCVNNLRQWGLAIRAYTDDNDDVLPHRGQGVQVLTRIDRPEDWFNAVPFYFGSKSFQDLVASGQAPKPKANWLIRGARRFSFINSQQPTQKFARLVRIRLCGLPMIW